MTPLRRLFQLGLLCVLLGPVIVSVPGWLVATWLGCAWGALVLAGMIGSWAQHRIVWIAYVSVAACSGQRGLIEVLHIEPYQAWLLVCVLIAGGWLIGKVTTASGAGDAQVSKAVTRWPQMNLWDLTTLTTCVALLCTIMPRVEEFFYLACQVAPALSGGLLLSLVAAQWAWRDAWSPATLIAALCLVLISALLVVPYTALDKAAIIALATWMIVGPIGVIAAQGSLVLAYMAVSRRWTLN